MGVVEKRIFTQGIDSDTTPELTQEGNYLSAKNMNIVVSDGANYGTAEVALGNTPYTITLPTGDNKCVGTYEDKTSNKLYYFNYNSLDQHGIYRISSDTQTVETVLVDPLLNFNTNYLITGIDIAYIDVDQPILGWTDGGSPNPEPTIIYTPPRQIDVNKAIAYTNGDFVNGYSAITIEVLDQIKWQPRFSPLVAIANDSLYNKNNITQKLFQFAYQYEYFDYSVSALSDYSEVVTPIGDEILGNAVAPPTYLNNRIDITLERGGDICNKIRIYARILNSTNSDWYLVDTIDNPTTPTIVYQFFNNKILEPVEINEANKPYDNVPRAAQAETIIAGGRKDWGNVLTDFDLPVPDVTLINQAIDLPVIDNALTELTAPLNVSTFSFDIGDLVSTGHAGLIFNIPNDPNLIVEGNLIRFLYISAPLPVLPTYIYYYITADDVADFNLLIANLILFLTNAGIQGVTNTGTFDPITGSPQPILPNQIFSNIGTLTSDYPQLSVAFTSDLFTAIVSSMSKRSSWKSGSTVTLALEYADRAGRFGTVVNDITFGVYIAFPTETLTTTPYIKQNQIIAAINHTPPIWGTTYRWKASVNTIQSFLQFSVKSVNNSGTQTNFELTPLIDYSDEYPSSILSYSYTSGDRLRIITNVADDVFSSYIDVPVNAYDEGTNVLSTNIINVAGVTLAAGDLVEIYTPRPDFTNEQTFYYTVCSQEYEIGDAGLPTRYHKGGVQDQTTTQPAISIIDRGNVWLRPREMNTYNPVIIPTPTHKYWVEDYNFSDFYNSKVYDKGRANKFDPNYRETRRPTTQIYSQPFIPETNINGLGSVFPENFASDDIRVLLAYGSIQKLYAEGVQLYVFQEIKTGVVRVNERVAFDAGSNNIVGATDQVLNPINYFAGDYGIGQHPESFAWYGYAKYHVDVRRGVVLRLSNDGYTPISSIYKVNNFTTDRFADIFQAGQKVNIYGAYNTRFNRYEYGVETTDLRDRTIQGYTFAFTEQSNTWTSFFDYLPDFMGSLGQELITFKNGTPYLHNSGTDYANYYGVQYNGELQVVFNQQPSESKLYNTVAIEGTDAWDIPLITVFDGVNTQESSLVASDFDLYEGKYRAWFLMDVLTPNVTNPLFDGDYLRGRYIILNMVSPTNKYARIFALDVNTIPSAISRL